MKREPCPRCHRWILPQMSSAQPGDGRPQYRCPCCDHTWTMGKTAKQRRLAREVSELGERA